MFCVSFLAFTSVAAGFSIFGEQSALSPVPANTAQYLLDLASNEVDLHYFGNEQIFAFVLSPALRQHLENIASKSNIQAMPVVYGLSHLSAGVCDWNRVPGWTNSTSGANAKHVFYGREVLKAPNTPFGNAIHLSLGPDVDPEGWTHEEMSENFMFWKDIHEHGEPVYIADGVRQFRTNIASQLGGTFAQRWGSEVTTKAHRFALQMYSCRSQSDDQNPGALFFETYPRSMPPTEQVLFFEAEDGCKGCPCPAASAGHQRLYEAIDAAWQKLNGPRAPGSKAVIAASIAALTAVGLALVVLRRRARNFDFESAQVE